MKRVERAICRNGSLIFPFLALSCDFDGPSIGKGTVLSTRTETDSAEDQDYANGSYDDPNVVLCLITKLSVQGKVGISKMKPGSWAPQGSIQISMARAFDDVGWRRQPGSAWMLRYLRHATPATESLLLPGSPRMALAGGIEPFARRDPTLRQTVTKVIKEESGVTIDLSCPILSRIERPWPLLAPSKPPPTPPAALRWDNSWLFNPGRPRDEATRSADPVPRQGPACFFPQSSSVTL